MQWHMLVGGREGGKGGEEQLCLCSEEGKNQH